MIVSGLDNSLKSMTNSYKYLFLRSVLDLLKDSHFKQEKFSFEEISLQMLINSWRPILFYRLSFGSQDQIEKKLNKVVNSNPQITKIRELSDKEKIKEILQREDPTSYIEIMRYVPQRILRGFFGKELRGKKDGVKDNLTIKLSQNNKDCLYVIDTSHDDPNPHTPNSLGRRNIIVNQSWMNYFEENLPIVIGWMERYWIDYLASRNPAIPNISNKIKPTISRNLSRQRGLWADYLEEKNLRCIFSGDLLTPSNFALDHFIPFSFVAHNEYWNLVPVISQFNKTNKLNPNSSKSNVLPDLKYVEKFADIQFSFLRYLSANINTTKENKIFSEYKNFLLVSEIPLDSNKIKKMLIEKITQQINTATSHGFLGGWLYKN